MKRIYIAEAVVTIHGRPSKAMADQIRTVAKERLRETIGRVTAEEMRTIEDAIRVQLAL